MTRNGSRIGAILGARGDTVEFLGYGVYVGDEVPVTAAGQLGDICREAAAPNPKLVLDDGSIVWGCECWWGPEDAVRERLKRYKRVAVVEIEAVRRKFLEEG